MHQLNLLAELSKIDEQIGSLKSREFDSPSNYHNSLDNGDERELLSQLVKSRNDLAGRIDERLRKVFDRLQTRYKGTALSKVIDNSCSSCNIGLSSLSINALKNRGELTFCEYCGRILVY